MDAPRTMEPREAGQVISKALKDPKRPRTVADVAAESGLATRDAEVGLHWLTSEYRGHLRVTDDGDLVHVFPHGFTKPWETRDAVDRLLSSIGRGLLGIGRFVVRAWILVVMVGYAALFLALVIGLAFARQGNDRDRGPGVGFLGVIFRVLAEAFFWTFHPFSPFYGASYGYAPALEVARQRRRSVEQEVPFYQKVNRFVFGPELPPEDPHAMRAKILAEIRAQKGRIGLADVMRVTGLPRDEADPLMARLMLDHDGTVDVGEQGGIVYRFESLRRTADSEARVPSQRAAWETPKQLPPLTGNGAGSNVAISLLNGFNMLMGAWVMERGLTISNILLLFSKHPPRFLPDDGLPIALGLVPAVFSLMLFVLPAARAAFRGRKQRHVAEENARLGILREVLARAPKKEPVSDETLRKAYRVATGKDPTSKEITKRVVELGGDVDVGPQGEVRYRFADLEAEAEALEDERAQASEGEARLGRVVFASDE